MVYKYGPTLNVRKMLYLKKSDILPRDLYNIILLFMIDPNIDNVRKSTKKDYKLLFSESDNFSKNNSNLEDNWQYINCNKRLRKVRTIMSVFI